MRIHIWLSIDFSDVHVRDFTLYRVHAQFILKQRQWTMGHEMNMKGFLVVWMTIKYSTVYLCSMLDAGATDNNLWTLVNFSDSKLKIKFFVVIIVLFTRFECFCRRDAKLFSLWILKYQKHKRNKSCNGHHSSFVVYS